MLNDTKKHVLDANKQLPKHELVKFTWGNVSEYDDETKLVVIKPSGVNYDDLTLDNMVVLDLDGNIVEGNYRPSSDTKTHLEVYKAYKNVKGICHVHSTYATAFAQAGKSIDAYGTTHADYFYGSIPCARVLTKEEIDADYEQSTGLLIVEIFKDKDILATPGVLLQGHGVFTFGKNANEAVHNAVVLEEVAKMNYLTLTLNKEAKPIPDYLLDKHYKRKHGKNAYYGQK